MVRRYFIATGTVSILLLAVVFAFVWSASDAQAADQGETYSKTFTSQCPGGTVEVWHPGGFDSGSPSVTVTGTYSAYGKERHSDHFIAVSTGLGCSSAMFESVIVIERTSVPDNGSPTPIPPSATPPSILRIQNTETGEYLYRPNGAPITDGAALERTQGSVVVSNIPGVDPSFEQTGQGTCIGGFYYSGLNENGQYSRSRCMTESEAQESGWTSDNVEGLSASTTEPVVEERISELQRGKPGTIYTLNKPNSPVRWTGCLLPTDPAPAWPSQWTTTEPCTVQ